MGAVNTHKHTIITVMLRSLFLGVVFLGLAFAHEGNNTDKGIFDCLTGPCVTIPGVGKIQGSRKQTQYTGRDWYGFWSIPFAESTEGANRFQPPVRRGPLNNGNDAYDASYTSYTLNLLNRMCPQPGTGSAEKSEGETDNPFLALIEKMYPDAIPHGHKERGLLDTIGNEDCLHVAVFTPELPSNSRNPNLPVMVYIHGGAFMMGGYVGAGPGKLLERDMVLVEIQYRLGPLGFMCLPNDEIAGNMGMLDQVMGLEWIQNTIHYFGGDPQKVTIMGESAGSASVTYHRISPMSQNLWHQSIAESGSALASWAFDSEPEKHAKDIAASLGCNMDTNESLISCLRNDVSTDQILLAHKKYYQAERSEGRLGFGGSAPCAQTHGSQKFITQHPLDYQIDAISAGVTHKKPGLYGANKHEGSFVLGVMYNSYFVPNDVLNDAFFLEHRFISTLLKALGLYDSSGNIYEMLEYTFFHHSDLGYWDKMMDGMINLVGVFFIKAATHEFMKNEVLAGVPSWYYSFEYYGEHSLWNILFPTAKPPIDRGVTHGDEMIYIFSTGLFDFAQEDWDMAWKMSNLWANFVIYGNPTPGDHGIEGVPTWPQWNVDNNEYMILDSYPRIENNYVATWANPDRN